MYFEFKWDPEKAASNLRKHRVSFETAARVFADPFALAEQDRFEHGEHRWQTIGLVDGHVVLTVAHTLAQASAQSPGRGGDVECVRIISARRADPKERKRYDQNRALQN
jgi:uncharacterized protein